MIFGHNTFGAQTVTTLAAGERDGNADPNLIWEWFPTKNDAGMDSGGSWKVTGYRNGNGGNGNGNGGNGDPVPQEQDTGGQESNGWEDEDDTEEEQEDPRQGPEGGEGEAYDPVSTSSAESWYSTPDGRAPVIKVVLLTLGLFFVHRSGYLAGKNNLFS